MNYTPLDIRHQEFPKRMNGYDPAAVRSFLASVAEQFEQLLMQQQAQGEFLTDLERQLEEKRANEDEIRRAIIAAERISHELRENAVRESEQMIAQATREREALLADLEGRTREADAQHEARMATLESAFRTRGAELERQFHQVLLERERAQAERLAALDQTYLERHSEFTARLSAARQEYAQFVSGYRALASSFADMASRHLLPDALLGTQALPDAPTLPSLPRTVTMKAVEAAASRPPVSPSPNLIPPGHTPPPAPDVDGPVLEGVAPTTTEGGPPTIEGLNWLDGIDLPAMNPAGTPEPTPRQDERD
jgi:cell division initiation protein